MTLTKGYIVLSAACVVAGILLGAGFRSCSQNKQPAPEPIVIHDTLTITDTLHIAEHSRPVKPLPPDTLWFKPDTVRDSIFVPIPITAYEYRDTFLTDTSRIELGIRYEGYNAKIDGIDLQYRFECQPRIVEKKKGWGQFIGIGIGVGYGVSVIGQTVNAAPEIGVHITYGFGYHF